jgi:hypothetical protein
MATVEIDQLEDDAAHAYVDGLIGDDGHSRAMIFCARRATVRNGRTRYTWEASLNADDTWYASASTLPTLAKKLARLFGHDLATATFAIDDERR